MRYATFAMNTAFLIARCVAGAMALYATAKHPYNFYVLTRWALFIVCFWGVWMCWRGVRASLVPAYIAIGVIFNPFLPFHFARSTWQAFDMLAGIVLLASVVITQTVNLQKPEDMDTSR
jgi:predicted ABC-type exoprotein transport system permease subunit